MNTKKICSQILDVIESLSHNKIIFKKLEKDVCAWVYHYSTGRDPRKNVVEKIEIDHRKGELLETIIHEAFHILYPEIEDDKRIRHLENEWMKKSRWKEKQEVLLCFLGKTTKKYGRQISSKKKSA